MRWVALVSLLLLAPAIASAQYALPSASSAVSISLSPQYPGPEETVNLTLTSTLYDLNEELIVWSADGRTIAEGEGLTEVTVTAPARNASARVVANVGPGIAEASVSITPTKVDILWESDSYTPPFYRGRALPSAGTTVRLQAIAHLPDGAGGEVPSNRITYTWKRNGGVLQQFSGRGRTTATIEAPYLFGADTLTVEAVSIDGSAAGSASVRIPSIEPLLTLYQEHPVFGRLYHAALGASTFINESEMTFAAEPYFAEAGSARDSLLRYEWRVNQTAVKADASNPNLLTINASNSTGIARIDLSLTHSQNLFLSADGLWRLTFSRPGEGVNFSNPFTREPL